MSRDNERRPTADPSESESGGARSGLSARAPEEGGSLFVSFWQIGFENIPVGTFAHRILPAGEAGGLIDAARANGTLCCVSDENLFAPEHEHERQNHERLCEVLTQRCGIALSFADFIVVDECSDGEELESLRPLVLADIGASNRMLVVNCMYEMAKTEPPVALQFELDPESITFHLFEASSISPEGQGEQTQVTVSSLTE